MTELLQPINSVVCAGAFQVNGPAGVGTGPFVCPFGTNAVLTTITTTGPTIFTPNIPGSGPIFQNGGIPIPAANTAAYPAAIPELICNFVAQPANVTITTIQAMATCPMAANVQNSNGKILRVTGHLVFSNGTTTQSTISLTEGGITPMTITPIVTSAATTNAQQTFDYYLTTASTGTAGTLEGHGTLCTQLTATNTTALSCSADALTAVSAAINLAAANNLVINITETSSTSTATLRDAQVWLLN